jgi:hypothetical protein
MEKVTLLNLKRNHLPEKTFWKQNQSKSHFVFCWHFAIYCDGKTLYASKIFLYLVGKWRNWCLYHLYIYIRVKIFRIWNTKLKNFCYQSQWYQKRKLTEKAQLYEHQYLQSKRSTTEDPGLMEERGRYLISGGR